MAETDIGPEDANATVAAPEPHAPELHAPELHAPERHGPEPHAAESHAAEAWPAERAEPVTQVERTDRAAEVPGRVRRRPPAGWLVIAVPAAVSFVVGGYEIGGPSLWRDEAYTKDAIERPVSQIFALLRHQDAVHGAYYLLMHVIAAEVPAAAAITCRRT